MRPAIICLVSVSLIAVQVFRSPTGEVAVKDASGLEKLLATYLQNRVAQARLALNGLKEAGITTVPELLAAEDEVARWELHLRLAKEGKLTRFHPVLGELRQEHGVPEVSKAASGADEVISALIVEYIEKKLARAERALEAAQALRNFGRGTESELEAARRKVEGLKLLLEAYRLNLRKERG